MTDKDVLRKYVSDMHATESHIRQAISEQMTLANKDPEAKQKFTEFQATLKAHLSSLEARLKVLGGNPANPIKDAGATVLGAAAGLIDKVRANEISKDLRDDYTALNLSVISYMMLNATAKAVGDQETATLAEQNAKDNADFVMWINNNIARFLVKDLQDSGAQLNAAAEQASMSIAHDIWTQ